MTENQVEVDDGLPLEVIKQQVVEKSYRSIHRIVSCIEEGLYVGKLDRELMKAYVDAVKVLTSSDDYFAADGVVRKITIKAQKPDMTLLMEESIRRKREHGDQFDEVAFFKEAIEGSTQVKKSDV